MTAINLPHFKRKLRDISRALYIEHGWKLPRGLMDGAQRDPLNFTRAEWQQARRAGHDPKMLKAMFQECWAISDSPKALAKALEERGYWLARGDRRGHVAVDFRGEVYALAKWTGIRAKEVKAKLGNPQALPSLEETRAQIAARMTNQVRRFIGESEAAFKTQSASLSFRKAEMVQRHRHERDQLKAFQEARWIKETNRRAARLPRGLRGVWSWLTGKYRRIREENERETWLAYRRDQDQKDALILRHLEDRQTLQEHILTARREHARGVAQLHSDVAHYMRLRAQEPPQAREAFRDAAREKQQERQRGYDRPSPQRGQGRRRRRDRDFGPG